MPNGCLLWSGAKHRDGHGKVTVNGETWATHRLVYWLTHGSLPQGLGVLHRCGNAGCINADHLYVGTDADNTRDKLAHGTQPTGEAIPWHKISFVEAQIIRRTSFYRGGKKALAAHLGISASAISNVISGKSWSGR